MNTEPSTATVPLTEIRRSEELVWFVALIGGVIAVLVLVVHSPLGGYGTGLQAAERIVLGRLVFCRSACKHGSLVPGDGLVVHPHARRVLQAREADHLRTAAGVTLRGDSWR